MNNDIVLLNVRISMWGVTRTLRDQQYEVDADKTLTRASKKILECSEYETVLALKRSIHRKLHSLALPGNVLRAGVYPVSSAMVDQIEKTLEEFQMNWQLAVMGLGQVWDIRVRDVADRLQGLYNADDYPAWEKVSQCFGVKWNYFTMQVPGALATVSSSLLQREKAKAMEDWTSMLDEIRDGLRYAFKELVDGLVERLTPNPDGTKKRLTGVERLLEFVDVFAKKNVTGDQELQSLVEDVRGLLDGTSVGQLRSDRKMREYAVERMESVKVVLDTLVEDAPSRQMVLRD